MTHLNKLACIFITTFLLIVLQTSAQTKNNENSFSFVENSSGISSLKFIQTFKCISIKGDDLASLYRAIKQNAEGKGGNCFIFKNFSRDSTGTMTLTLDTYYGDDAFIKQNFNNHEKNTVYIISDGNFSKKTYAFNVNNEKRIIKSGTYYKHTLKKEEKTKFNKGGFLGMTVITAWEENKICEFFSLSGFDLYDGLFGSTRSYYGRNPAAAEVSFTSGKFKSVDINFGLLLTKILKQTPTIEK